MGFEVTGLDDINNRLAELTARAKKLSGEEEQSLDELFDEGFMTRHTGFASLAAFFDDCDYPAANEAEIAAVPAEELDAYVRANSPFASFADMKAVAVQDKVLRSL